MKAKSINKFLVILLTLTSSSFLGCGCNTSKSAANPLAEFRLSTIDELDANKTIVSDYRAYVQNIPSKDKDFVGPVQYFTADTGQHAVDISIGLNGTYWEYILIYDTNNCRINVIKHRNGGYRS